MEIPLNYLISLHIPSILCQESELYSFLLSSRLPPVCLSVCPSVRLSVSFIGSMHRHTFNTITSLDALPCISYVSTFLPMILWNVFVVTAASFSLSLPLSFSYFPSSPDACPHSSPSSVTFFPY